jgi:hypothetical protein
MSDEETIVPPDEEEFQPYYTQSFRKSYVCYLCGHHFKEGRGGLIAGTPYCFQYGCYEEELDTRLRRR